ncbi:hypothetical protein [Caldisericum exile]|uniref:Uncharacterized protein n=1 Tax=Caldisericum exile (strain DSM 21853 / NBRC 104410 / AZM16c01) TaxID=511051 RepID=A0A7U6GDP2_CALEA|nr:hypothetical protein [Caldisericum exile]BAL80486.1 hypothetical protein CSE_03600 [Caldisericum exile AZM16c01]
MIIVLLFLVLAFIPFFLAIIEVVSKRDILPLNINFSFTRDPRFFGKSFRHKIENVVKMIS